jgi:hypothetical protein
MAIEWPCEADVHSSPEAIFDLIVDLRDQERWLGKSSAFRPLLALKAYADTLD